MLLKIAITNQSLFDRPEIQALITAGHQVSLVGDWDLILGPQAWFFSHEHANEGLLDMAIKRSRQLAKLVEGRQKVVKVKPTKVKAPRGAGDSPGGRKAGKRGKVAGTTAGVSPSPPGASTGAIAGGVVEVEIPS